MIKTYKSLFLSFMCLLFVSALSQENKQTIKNDNITTNEKYISTDTTQVSVKKEDHYQLSLEECIEYAFGNSLTRQKMKLSEKNSEYGYEQAKNARHPGVSGSFGETVSHTGRESNVNINGNLGIGANATLYQGGAIKNNIEKARLEANAAVSRTSQTDQNLIIKILENFLTVLLNDEMLKSQERILKISEEQLRQGEEKYKAGAMLQSDYLSLKAQVETDKCNMLNSEINRDNAILNLKIILSMDPSTDLSLVYPDTTDIESMIVMPTLDVCIQRTLDSHPDLQLADYDIAIANINKEIAKAGRRPTISANAGLSTGHTNFNDFGNQLLDRFNQNIGVSMSIPIYDKGVTKTNLKMRDIEIKMSEIEKEDKTLQIKQQITSEYLNVTLAYNQTKAYQLKAEAYSKVFEAYNLRFQYGAITSVDLLQQQNNYINALSDYVKTKYGFILRRKILDVYMDCPVTYVAGDDANRGEDNLENK